MQPSYLPWVGYFALMDQVDIFVFLDSVQFDRRSWQQRNRIKILSGMQMLTVPVFKKGFRDQCIADVRIDRTTDFAKKHIRTISMAYTKAPFFKQYEEDIFNVISERFEKLADLTTSLILKIQDILGIECRCVNSKDLNEKGSKAELLANICERLDGKTYISPVGSKVYLEQSDSFKRGGIEVKYNNFKNPVYNQLGGEFIPYMSVIDLIFNEGPKSIEIIRKGIVME